MQNRADNRECFYVISREGRGEVGALVEDGRLQKEVEGGEGGREGGGRRCRLESQDFSPVQAIRPSTWIVAENEIETTGLAKHFIDII